KTSAVRWTMRVSRILSRPLASTGHDPPSRPAVPPSRRPPARDPPAFDALPPMPTRDLPVTAPGRLSDTHSAGFGTTVFDVLTRDAAAAKVPASVFDVCHVGVVLRALLFAHGVLAV